MPISGQPIAEGGRLFGIESRSKVERRGSQFSLALIKQPMERFQFARRTLVATMLPDCLSKPDEVMVITEVFTERLQFPGHCVHLFRPDRIEEGHVVPQILCAFTPFTEIFR